MPSGQTHSVVTSGLLCVTALAVPVAVPVFGIEYLGITAGCLLGLVLTPDLDINGHTASSYWIGRLTGKLIKELWRWFWVPYSIIRHRSWVSHGLIISTVLRLLYVFAIPLTVLFVSQPKFLYVFVEQWRWILWITIGLILVDSFHIAMDKIF